MPSSFHRRLRRSVAALGVAAATLLAAAPASTPAEADLYSCAEASKLQALVNEKMAVRFLYQLFTRGDLSAIDAYVQPNLIQHNPAVADGAAGLRQFVTGLKAQYPNSFVATKRVIAEGDLVLLHNNFVLTPGTKGIDSVNILRIENGKIAEAWEIDLQVPDATVSGNDMFSTITSPPPVSCIIGAPQVACPDLSVNADETKTIASNLFTDVVDGRDLTAFDRYAVDPYYNHSAYVANGIAAAKQLFVGTFAQYPSVTADIRRVIAQGDLVAIHYHLRRTPPNDPGLDILDISRVRNGKVVEFWDIIEEVPTSSLNNNGMF